MKRHVEEPRFPLINFLATTLELDHFDVSQRSMDPILIATDLYCGRSSIKRMRMDIASSSELGFFKRMKSNVIISNLFVDFKGRR